MLGLRSFWSQWRKMFKGVSPAKSAQMEQATARLIYGKRLLWGAGHVESRETSRILAINKASSGGGQEDRVLRACGKWEASGRATKFLYLALMAGATTLKQHLLAFGAWEWPSPTPSNSMSLSQSHRAQQNGLVQNSALNRKPATCIRKSGK